MSCVLYGESCLNSVHCVSGLNVKYLVGVKSTLDKVENSGLRGGLLMGSDGIGHWWVQGKVCSRFTVLSFFFVYTGASLRVLHVSCASCRVP